MTKIKEKIEYISMVEAAEITPYAQDYLSLLCRRDQLKSKKIGRKWYTTKRWLNDYLREKKPGDVIEKSEERIGSDVFFGHQMSKFWSVLTMFVFGFSVFIFGIIIWQKIDKIEESKSNFVPEEITKVPNENGGYDVYGEGRIKIGEEKIEGNDSSILNP